MATDTALKQKLAKLEEAVRWVLSDPDVIRAITSEPWPCGDDEERDKRTDAFLETLKPYMDGETVREALLDPDSDDDWGGRSWD